MVLALFGESCTGKSTVAALLKKHNGAEVVSGKDYLRLAKNETEAKRLFEEKLRTACDREELLVYVISEREQLALLPEHAFRALFTAELSAIKERFKKRMNGSLPVPVEAAIERKHGMFDAESHRFHAFEKAPEETYSALCAACGLQSGLSAANFKQI